MEKILGAYQELEEYCRKNKISAKKTAQAKNIFFSWLYCFSPSLYLAFVINHKKIGDVYTPGIAPAVEDFALIKKFMPEIIDPLLIGFRRGNKEEIREDIKRKILEYAKRVYKFFKTDDEPEWTDDMMGRFLAVVTDGGRVLGIGDQGAKGRYIVAGKLRCYFLGSSGAILPQFSLPIGLDVGTDPANYNLRVLPFGSPMATHHGDPGHGAPRLMSPVTKTKVEYDGLRIPRLRGKEYFDFVTMVLEVLDGLSVGLVQFEDFQGDNAWEILKWARKSMKTAVFNDDLEGTAAMVGGALLAAKRQGINLDNSLYFFIGAGGAASGIAEQFKWWSKKAEEKFFFFDSAGLLYQDRKVKSEDGKNEFKKFQEEANMVIRDRRLTKLNGRGKGIDLKPVVHNFRDEIGENGSAFFIGTSATAGVLDGESIREAAEAVKDRPVVILGLSNPTEKTDFLTREESRNYLEANTKEKKSEILEGVIRRIYDTACGRALIGTGSPFPSLRQIEVAQANNLFIFPGVGLGIWIAGADKITKEMWMAATEALFSCFINNPKEKERIAKGALFPKSENIQKISEEIALSVAMEAVRTARKKARVKVSAEWLDMPDKKLKSKLSEKLNILRKKLRERKELATELFNFVEEKRPAERFIAENC